MMGNFLAGPPGPEPKPEWIGGYCDHCDEMEPADETIIWYQYECPGCLRDGCPGCMPNGQDADCPDCEGV